MQCLIKGTSIYWQSSFGLRKFLFQRALTLLLLSLQPSLCVQVLFSPFPFFFHMFFECQILNVSALAESLGDEREKKMGLKQVAGKAHMGWHSHGKLFLFKELSTSLHADLMNTGGSTYFSWAWKANVVLECKVYYQCNQLE